MLILIILAATSLVHGAVPGDLDGDKIVSQDELQKAEEQLKDGKISAEQMEEIKHINENYPRKVTDSLGNEVVIYAPVKKIIAINSNAVELLRSIKAEDKIIAVDDSVKNDNIFFPELGQLPNVGTGRAPDSEKMLELRPDLVIISATWDKSYGDTLQNTLNSADKNISVIRLDCYRLETYENETNSLAYLLEREDQAKEFVAFFNKCLKGITNKTATLSKDCLLYTSP
ncbi:MAG: ABC transporter substrate-binding protein, partial [Methanothrix sp.]|nr:ABC transporter substrate-binding protein [Methanothrix sp.]